MCCFRRSTHGAGGVGGGGAVGRGVGEVGVVGLDGGGGGRPKGDEGGKMNMAKKGMQRKGESDRICQKL